jgi:Fic-DOC domain mobile mystery protein B
MPDETDLAGTTPGDDTSGLILTQLTTRAARNAAEADAISLAYNKYIFEARKKKRGTQWLTDDFICRTHRDMFGSIWEWAGKYRKDKLNIGVDPHLIPEQIRLLCDDFLLWDSPASTMPVLEVAARLQNRLTKIHPFRNGNGRHARLITDVFFHSRQHPLPQWPQIHLMPQGHEVRAQYISAMKKADQGDSSGLIKFIEGCIPKPS